MPKTPQQSRPESRAPAAFWVLGLSGLIPFIALALIIHHGPIAWSAFWSDALARYGAVILAFVGAIHWGFAMRRQAAGATGWIQYGWSVVPALLGWTTLLVPVTSGLRIQAIFLFACLGVDWLFGRIDPTPAWFIQLRAILTAVAATALLYASLA